MPLLLLLDEPTESLDRETERQILTLILAHCRHKTLLIVTRLTAIEQFDRICIIDDAPYPNKAVAIRNSCKNHKVLNN